jgi:inorganic pyrophosphatase
MIKVCVQVEAGSCEKRLYDERTLEFKETRRVSRPYPYPYGFILGTRAPDGDSVDCYLITRARLQSGTIVECEPVGLLEQHEDEEVDHKVLAAMPGQHVVADQKLLQELQDFIYGIFAQHPGVRVTVGPVLPRAAALHHIQEHSAPADAAAPQG